MNNWKATKNRLPSVCSWSHLTRLNKWKEDECRRFPRFTVSQSLFPQGIHFNIASAFIINICTCNNNTCVNPRTIKYETEMLMNTSDQFISFNCVSLWSCCKLHFKRASEDGYYCITIACCVPVLRLSDHKCAHFVAIAYKHDKCLAPIYCRVSGRWFCLFCFGIRSNGVRSTQ